MNRNEEDQKRALIVLLGLSLVFVGVVGILAVAGLPDLSSGFSGRMDSVVTTTAGQTTGTETTVLVGSERHTVKINLNTATAEQLQDLNGIGEVLAERILAYRSENGGFRSVDELLNVEGIGEKRLMQIRDRLMI